MSEFDVNEFVTAQHSLNIRMSESLARIEQSQTDTRQRLFGGEGQVGILPYMAEQAKTVAVESGKRVDGVETRLSAIETFKNGTIRWVGGAIAVITAEAGLVVFYFDHVARKVQEVQALLPKH
jgi:hypothetical protein